MTSDDVKAGKKMAQFAGDEAAQLKLVYGGDDSFERSGIHFVSWRNLLI